MFEVAKNAIEIMASRISAPDKPHTTLILITTF